MNFVPTQFEMLETSVKRLSARVPDTPELCILIVRVLQQLARGLSEMVEQQLRPFGLAEAEFRVLMTLFSQPEGVGHPTDLCARTSQRPANMSRICDALVARDLITRISSDHDRRRMVLRITARGEELVRRMLPVLFPALRELFEGLSQQEHSLLLQLLQGVAGKLDSVTARHAAERSV
jgi:MarR family transcriptional repressor of emrRAB